MNIIKNIKVSTGNICIMQGEKGKIEFLSIGDYGRNANVKADCLGLTDEINGVPNGKIIPLEEKWVITISSQYGCSMDCKFCCEISLICFFLFIIFKYLFNNSSLGSIIILPSFASIINVVLPG